MTTLTDRQEAALDRLVAFARRHDVDIRDRHWLSIAFEPESRPGRGHDIVVSYADSDHVISARIDVYGHGTTSLGAVEWMHDGSEEHTCTICPEGDTP